MKMVLDVVLHLDESISIYGAVAIFDMKGVTWQHSLEMTPTIIKRYYNNKIEQILNFVEIEFHQLLYDQTGLSIVGKIIHVK